MPNRLPACDHDHRASLDGRRTLPHRETVEPDPSPVNSLPPSPPRFDIVAGPSHELILGKIKMTHEKRSFTSNYHVAERVGYVMAQE